MPQTDAAADAPPYTAVSARPELETLEQAARRGDWPEARSLLEAVTDPDDRWFAVQAVLSTAGPAEDWLASATAGDDAPELARVALASWQTSHGWSIRTGARANKVSRDQFDQFHAWLRKAELLLIEATAVDPQDQLAWTARLLTARGLSLGGAEARRRYDRLARINPHHYGAQRQLVQQLCPKWTGTWEELHAFATACHREAEPGALSHAVVPHAHWEHALDFKGDERAAYLRGSAVLDELTAASASLRDGAGPRGYSAANAHAFFAACFARAARWRDARPHFAAMTDRVSLAPWGSGARGLQHYTEQRRRAMDQD